MVEHALSNIAEGIYGECEQCGNEINERRLEAVPWARHCIACQEKAGARRTGATSTGELILIEPAAFLRFASG